MARALYKQLKMLFLDEATSYLDTAREDMVNRAVCALDMTRIVIAHCPQTIAAMERVIRLDKEVEHEGQRSSHVADDRQLWAA